jgi:hypothetical protein
MSETLKAKRQNCHFGYPIIPYAKRQKCPELRTNLSFGSCKNDKKCPSIKTLLK